MPQISPVVASSSSSGSLPTPVGVSDGGTGITSYDVGDLLYASGTTTLAKLSDVATGQVLVSGGVGVAPSWSGSPTVTTLTAQRSTSSIMDKSITIATTSTASGGTPRRDSPALVFTGQAWSGAVSVPVEWAIKERASSATLPRLAFSWSTDQTNYTESFSIWQPSGSAGLVFLDSPVGLYIGVNSSEIIDLGVTNTGLTVSAGKSLTMAAGVGALSLGSATGNWAMPTGSGSWAGASGKTLSLQSTAANVTIQSLTSGTVLIDSAATLNIGTSAATAITIGRSATTTTMNSFIMAGGADITTNAGASDFDFGLSTGAFWFPTGNIFCSLASNKTITMSTSGASGQIQVTATSSAITLNAGGLMSIIGYSGVNLQYGGSTAFAVNSSTLVAQSGWVLQANSGTKVLGTAPAAAADAVSSGVVDINGAGTAALKNIYEGGATKVERVEGSTGAINVMHIARDFTDDETLTLPVPSTGKIGVLDIYSDVNASQGCVVILPDGSINSTPLAGINFSTTDTDTFLCVYDGGTNPILKNRLGSTKFLIGTYRWQ